MFPDLTPVEQPTTNARTSRSGLLDQGSGPFASHNIISALGEGHDRRARSVAPRMLPDPRHGSHGRRAHDPGHRAGEPRDSKKRESEGHAARGPHARAWRTRSRAPDL